jgi:DNA-binding Lrp family transcriptional regulator
LVEGILERPVALGRWGIRARYGAPPEPAAVDRSRPYRLLAGGPYRFVDDRDLDLLRWMYPQGVRSWSIDPRITASDIAAQVGLSRKAVWARLRQWRKEGFWQGLYVRPNLTIFGARPLRAEIRVRDVAEGRGLFKELEVIEGVLGALLSFGDTARETDVHSVLVHVAGETADGVGKTMRQLRRLAPSGTVDGPWADRPPAVSMRLTRLDWRLMAEFVAQPEAPLSRIGSRVGVTLRTVVRRRSRLLDHQVLAYRPMVDWTRHPSVLITLYCRGPQHLGRLRESLAARFPHRLEFSPEGLGYVGEGYSPTTCYAARVPAHTPGAVQSLVLELSALPGVKAVRPEVWVEYRDYPRWIHQRIAERITGPSPSHAG